MTARTVQARPGGIQSLGLGVRRSLAELGGASFEDPGSNTGTSQGTTVTNAGSTNTKGSYTQLIAATAADAYGIVVTMGGVSSANPYLVDIAVGAAASEVVIIPNLQWQQSNGNLYASYFFPIFIPSGSRIAARSQGGTASATIVVSTTLIEGRSQLVNREISTATAMGIVSSGASNGTAVTASGSTNTKGSYAEIVSSTAADFRYFVVSIERGSLSSVASFLVDIATGAGGSETVLIPNMHYVADGSSNNMTMPVPMPLFLPAGTRIAARCQCSVASKDVRVALYGVP